MGKSLALDESVGTALACEHARNVATVAWLRSAGVTFFLLVSLLGAWQGWAGWAEYVMPLSLYWLTALLVWRVSRLPHPAVRWLVRTVPFIDFFLAYWAQNESLPSSASASGVAGFTVGIFALQLMIASWAVKGSWLWLTGAWAMLLEVRLQSAAGVAVPAMIAACMLLLLTVIVCQTSQRWKRALIRRAIDEVREREMLSSRMMRSERHACAGAHAAGLARELSDRILGALAQSNFVLDHWEGNDSEEGRQRAMRACRDHLVAMSELTRLLDKLNEVPTQSEQVDVRRVLQGAVALSSTELSSRVLLLTAIESVPSVPAEHDKLQHLLVRTLFHACSDAPGTHGRNQVRIRCYQGDPKQVHVDIERSWTNALFDATLPWFELHQESDRSGSTWAVGFAACRALANAMPGVEIQWHELPNNQSLVRIILATPPLRDTAPVANPSRLATREVDGRLGYATN